MVTVFAHSTEAYFRLDINTAVTSKRTNNYILWRAVNIIEWKEKISECKDKLY